MDKKNKFPVKVSAQFASSAPQDAIALIVAECVIATVNGTRRVALGWLSGLRTDSKPLRDAAAKLDEIADLAAAGNEIEHQDIDGSILLKNSERCRVRWTIRSIPIALITCWAAFEDAITPTAATAEEAREKTTAPIAPKTESANPFSSAHPAVTARSAQPVRRLSEAPAPTAEQTPSPLPTFAPLSALILDRKKAFSGNCAEPGKFITDGRTLLLTSACDAKFVSKVKPITIGPYNPTNPLTTERAQKLFDSAAEDARHVSSIRGYVLGRSIAGHYDAEAPFACLTGPGDRISVVDGNRALLVQTVTGANIVKVLVDPRSPRVVFFKDNQPVAVLLATDDEKIRSLFQRMLDAESARQGIARIAA